MGAVATAARHLIAAGVTGDALVTALEEIEEANKPLRSVGAERTARWRARKKEDAERHSDVTVPPLKERSPTPPKENNPPVPSEPLSSSKRWRKAEEPEGFDEWYRTYPRPVDRKAAAKAYGRAAKEVPRDRLLAAAQRYAQKMQGTEPKFIKHPETWLNKGSWHDEETNTNGSGGKSQAELDALYAILDAPSPRRDGGQLPPEGEGVYPGER